MARFYAQLLVLLSYCACFLESFLGFDGVVVERHDGVLNQFYAVDYITIYKFLAKASTSFIPIQAGSAKNAMKDLMHFP